MKSTYQQFQALTQNNLKKRRNKWKMPSMSPFQPQSYEKFLFFLTNRRKKFLKERLTEYYGKNFPVNYRQHYGFEQQWENKLAAEAAGNYKGLNNQSKLQIGVSVLTILVLTITIWFSNIEFFIRSDGKSQSNELVYSLAIVIQCIDLLLKVRRQAMQRTYEISLLEYMEIGIKNMVCTIFLGLKLAQLQQRSSALWVIFEIVCLYLMFNRASELYQSLRLMNFSLHYEYETKVIDLILTLILIAHFLSLFMFSATKLNFQTSWLSALHIDETNEFIVYLYSFYFCATTILTVGYGDITPKNAAEVAIVTMVQIFGIVMFAYIINEIGYSISSLRKDREIVDKDLSIVEKMRVHYNMDDNLTNRTRSYIINHKPKIDQLSPSEETGIMIKLNEELRLQIAKKNMLSVVKSSIFFLCRWSKVFQAAISLKLNHILFNPNDIVFQPVDKERIYIIKSGKIHIFAQKKGGKKGISNIIKVIENKINKGITSNSYGYSAVISARPVKLYAVAKEFTSSYFIQKQKFLECVNERQCDFEYYHEIKSKIDQSFHSQSIEVPTLQSSKHHYTPTKVCLIRKYCKKEDTPNERQNCRRRFSHVFRGRKFLMDEETIRQARHVFISSMDSNNYETTQYLVNSDVLKIQINDQQEMANFIMANEVKNNLAHYFESSKQYRNYFPKNNKFQILRKYENEFFIPSGKVQEIMEFSSQMYKAARGTQ